MAEKLEQGLSFAECFLVEEGVQEVTEELGAKAGVADEYSAARSTEEAAPGMERELLKIFGGTLLGGSIEQLTC